MSPVNALYSQKINTVIDHMNANLDQSFKLNELAAIANFSSFHFHRIFVAIIGESVNFYTNRIRLEKAAKLITYSKQSLKDIAYACGLSSPATFSRSFKSYFGISPSNYRKTGKIDNSKICKELFPMDEYLVPMSLEEKAKQFPVAVKEFAKRKIAYIRVVNSYAEGVVANAFNSLLAWTKENKIYEESTFFGMSMDDPLVTPQEKYRYEACVQVPDNFEIRTHTSIQKMILARANYATTIVSGDIKRMATATHYLFDAWLLNSNYEPAHMHGIEIFLDKDNITNWEHFDLELCIPVVPLNSL